MPAPSLSIVAPVFNEAGVVAELVARCLRAAETRDVSCELVIADDASTDETPALLAALARDPRVVPCRLPANAGQFGATQAGIRAARGRWVVVLDGDLQDPPELIPQLVDALAAAPEAVLAVLAVKSHRDDPWPFMFGQFLFHRLQHLFSRVALPLGAGTYCIMRQVVAGRIGDAALARANLSAVVAVVVRGLGGELATVTYEKGPRYDGSGRVGWRGLIAEALESLAVTGALSRLLALAALVLGIAGVAAPGAPLARVALLAIAIAAGIAAFGVGRRTRHALASLRAAPAGE
ncbi:MAG: glycosyltransferase [Candidatus Binatia bacterium]